MKIRDKTDQEIQEDIDMVKQDTKMGVIRDDLFGELTKNNYPKYLTKSKKLEQQRNFFEKDGTLVLRICNEKRPVIGYNSGRRSTASQVIIEFGKYKKYLYFHKKLAQGNITDLKIFMQNDHGTYELQIPNKDKHGLLSYLIEGSPPKGFDCQSFVHKIKGVAMKDQNDNYNIITKKWIMKKAQIINLTVGNCICMFDYSSDNNTLHHGIKHFAYYLGNGLFISKLGYGGNILISSLQEIHDFYGTKEFLSMIPNPNYVETTIHNPILQ